MERFYNLVFCRSYWLGSSVRLLGEVLVRSGRLQTALFFTWLFFMSACTSPVDHKTTRPLIEEEGELVPKSEVAFEGMMNHIVLFKLKDAATAPMLLHELDKLSDIPSIKSIRSGRFKSLDDYRALSEYDVVMEVVLEDSLAYQNYQKHPLHLALKQKVKDLLAGPPATYDYIIQ